MDLLFVLITAFTFLLVSVTQGIFVAYPLIFTFIVLVIVQLKRGFRLDYLIAIAWKESRKSTVVILVLLLVGALTASWMAAGTVPALVYYGIELVHPQYFVFWAFILSSLVSLLIGTSFGTVSTIGVALIAIARGNESNSALVAGAIIAGAYVGDRCSPVSSSAHLIASITDTKIYPNLKNMVKTAWLPLAVAILIYLLLSWLNPISTTDSTLAPEIAQVFALNFWVFLPAIAIVVLSLLKVEVKLTMLISLVIAIAVGLAVQEYSLIQLFKFILFGFNIKTPNLNEILSGGGVVSMIRVTVVVIASTAIAGILAGTKSLEVIAPILHQAKSRSDLLLGTTIASVVAAAFGCTQTIAILLTQQFVQAQYQQAKLDKYQLAVDLENTAVVLSPLVPWNIAGLVPATILMTDYGFIPYAVYLYLLPSLNLLQLKLKESR